MMPLTLAPANKEFIITKIYAEPKVKTHLDNLGILVGSEITPIIIRDGNIIVKVKESRLALNKEVASKILVR